MRKHTPGGPLALRPGGRRRGGTALVAGAASGNHWADYNGTADSHELLSGNPRSVPGDRRAGSRSGSTASAADRGRRVPGRAIRSSGSSISTSTGDAELGAARRRGPPLRRRGGRHEGRHRTRWSTTTTPATAASTTPTRGSRRRSTRTATSTRAVRDQPRRLLLRPEGTTRAPKRPGRHEDRQASWEKVYTLGRREVASTSTPARPEAGRDRNGVQWKVDVTQTGSRCGTRRDRHDHGRRTRTATDVTGVSVTDALAGRGRGLRRCRGHRTSRPA